MTPEQKAKCYLLEIYIADWNPLGVDAGYYVGRSNPGCILCTPSEGNPVTWPTKFFNTIDEAIECAAAPAKHGLGWDE